MLARDKSNNTDFDNGTLESLLEMEEGPTLDFKRKQYRFDKVSDRDKSELLKDKSELLKDILAFANTQRYRTAYILLGVKEVRGGRSEVVGVESHLDDASLHQFVNYKTNRPVSFSYFPFKVEDKEIGVISIPLQVRPVYVHKKFGKVDDNAVYVRDGSSTRVASPNEIAAMGRGTPPKWAIDRLRSLARSAVEITFQQWREHPYRHNGHPLQNQRPSYEEARDFALRRSRLLEEYPNGIDSYGSLHYVFKKYEELASFCGQMFRTVGSGLLEYDVLIQAMIRLEDCVQAEKQVWSEFRMRTESPNTPLPAEASYNLLVIAELAVRLVDVLDSENMSEDPEYEFRRKYTPEVIRRSPQWGD